MIGDFILWIKEVLRENFCIHDYKPFGLYRPYDVGCHEKCKKCGRLK